MRSILSIEGLMCVLCALALLVYPADALGGWTLIGCDFDNCRNPETGELDPQASAALALCPSAYSEISPSENTG